MLRKLPPPLIEEFGREFPKDFLDIWLVGEESGKLEQATERLGKMATEKAEWMMGEIAKWLPRLIYAIISVWMIYNILLIATGAMQQIGLHS